ncbi:MAG TPA: AarF/ABC1/UbiB kinase family protein [Candidatus Limnocylindria bacterium]|jgi:ubiquinone biosynthesis protein|nr:AarF/ABC1/UbiB kinase family protein [Candidatus Limnocylindria bacterium]
MNVLHRFRQIGAAYHQGQRYRMIVGVFLKYGYEDLAHRLPLPSALRWTIRKTRAEQQAIARLSPPEKLRHALEELGPTFVKFGQLLSVRTHLLSRPFTEELKKLHDAVPPVPFGEVRQVIEAELRRPLGDCFLSVEEQPLGSASIGQVHAATLLSGECVVVKVQRPGIEPVVRTDLQIMAHLAGLLENHVDGWKVHRPTAVVAEFAKRLEQELDYTAEAAHLERFAHQFAGEPTLHVPRLYHATCTRRVLTMERIFAIKASQLAELDAAELDRREIATRIADLVMRQIFVHGFFHADPHPGNLHILPGNVICFLDFGMMGFLDQHTRETFADLVIGIAQRREGEVATALLKLAGAELDPPRAGFEADVAEFMHQHFYRTIGEMVFGKLVNHLFQLTSRHALTMPADLFTMLKALSLMENLVRRLDPEHDLIEQARPFMKQVRMDRVSPRRVLRELVTFGGETATFLREVPLEIRRLLAQIKGGKSKLTFHHDGLEPLNNTLERASNRLSFALVLASLLIASSLVIHAAVPPIWRGVSVLGLGGYVFAGLMGVWLLLSMLRHGRM